MFKKKKKKEKNTTPPPITAISFKEEIKKNLIAEINTEFIKTLKHKIKEEVLLEIKNQKSEFINNLKSELKHELENELRESIKKELLLEIKIFNVRKEKLNKKIATNKKNVINDKHIKSINKSINNSSNINVENLDVNQEKVSDEDLIKSFLQKVDIKENTNDLIDNKIIEASILKNTMLNSLPNITQDINNELTQTEVLNDTTFDKTELDLGNYTAQNDDDFFEVDDITCTKFSDNNLKEKLKNFSKEQNQTLKKATTELREISIKGLQISKEEICKLKEKEIYNKCLEKLKNLKNKI
ncbi:MAG: hypothetical protein ACRC41_12015 [Sarcina sp.]